MTARRYPPPKRMELLCNRKTKCREHCHPSVLDLNLTVKANFAFGGGAFRAVVVGAEASWIKEAQWLGNARKCLNKFRRIEINGFRSSRSRIFNGRENWWDVGRCILCHDNGSTHTRSHLLHHLQWQVQCLQRLFH